MLFGCVALGSKAQPPNNSIFFGGNGDGSMAASFSVSFNSIFAGSTGDGFANISNSALPNAIFAGGVGDGVSSTANLSVSNSIFSGSTGDGFNNETNFAVSNVIFSGGVGDGFNNESNFAVPNVIFSGSVGDGFVHSGNTALPNTIFSGGEGDGWHAVVLPLGPLPVTLLSFKAEQVAATHLVTWITAAEINTSHFEVQRSANARDFSTVSSTAAAGVLNAGASYNFTVLQPWTGNNFYRLKMADKDGSIDYSNIVLLKNIGDLPVSVFPNPTADWLYVSIPHFANSKTITASLLDANGRLLCQPILKPGSSNAIAVSNLPAGVYTLQCVINKKQFVFRFLKSN